MELLDAYGLGDVTMRRIARSLDVAPAALYWHIANKQALVAALARHILAPFLQSVPQDGPAAPSNGIPDIVRCLATRLRVTLLVHRDGAEVVTTALTTQGVRDPILARITEPLESIGVSPQDAHAGATTLLTFVLGSVTGEQNTVNAAAAVGTATAPHYPSHQTPPAPEEFSAGVDIIAVGLQERSHRHR